MDLFKYRKCFFFIVLFIVFFIVHNEMFIGYVYGLKIRNKQDPSIISPTDSKVEELKKKKEEDEAKNPWRDVMTKYVTSGSNNEKPIKGAEFGKWQNNKCKPLRNEQLNRALYDLRSCGFMKHRSLYITYNPDEWCKYLLHAPNCLIYNQYAFSFAKNSNSILPTYDLPPCFNYSENWVIEASCNSQGRQNYTCKNNQWVGNDGKNLTTCDSNDTWDQIKADMTKYNYEDDDDLTLIDYYEEFDDLSSGILKVVHIDNLLDTDEVAIESAEESDVEHTDQSAEKSSKDKKPNPWKEVMKLYVSPDINVVPPIKGAVFGRWRRTKCVALMNDQRNRVLYGLNDCGKKPLSSQWMSFTNNAWCKFFNEKPNCLVYHKNSFSFTRYSESILPAYDLPPCINESENWKVEAQCDSKQKQTYTCQNKKWIGDAGHNITKCNSSATWEDIEKDSKKIDEEDTDKKDTHQEDESQYFDDNDYYIFSDYEEEEEEEDDEESIENPWKDLMEIYGKSDNSNYRVKTVKGAVFGKWEKNSCRYLNNSQRDRLLLYLDGCTNRIFRGSQSGTNWGIYSNVTMCRLSDEQPDCFFYEKSALSFTSYGVPNVNEYVLPPCIDASKGWVIEAVCGSKPLQNYSCNGTSWIAQDNYVCDLVEDKTSKSLKIEPEEVENPWKDLMHIYELSNNTQVKTVKGAVFGRWDKNECRYLNNSQIDRSLYYLNRCTNTIFGRANSTHSRTPGTNWAIYSANTLCRLSDEEPNCFFYDKTALSFTSFGVPDVNDYVLPPCINASKNWIIEAVCNNGQLKPYTCDGKSWVGPNNDHCNESVKKINHELQKHVAVSEDSQKETSNEKEIQKKTEKNPSNDTMIPSNDTMIPSNDTMISDGAESKTETSEPSQDDMENNSLRLPKNADIKSIAEKLSSCDRIGISFGLIITAVAIFI